MMPTSRRLLLVEGINDQSFYTQFCKTHNLEIDVRVTPPREIGGLCNTKQGVINHLSILLHQLTDGQLERLGLVVDADQVLDGGGVERTVGQVREKLKPFGFVDIPTYLADGGIIFPHTDGLADLGLWVMPNNKDEGALEDWISQSAHTVELPLLAHAKSIVAALPAPKFKPLRRIKAEIATWLAWQDKPGEGLYYAVEGKLVDPAAPLYAGLKNWLIHIFH